jgi:hypothetical protein
LFEGCQKARCEARAVLHHSRNGDQFTSHPLALKTIVETRELLTLFIRHVPSIDSQPPEV